MLSGGGNPSFADATQALKNSINLPASNASVRYIQHLKIMACAILPSHHILTNWLRNHVRDMQSFSLDFEQWTPSLAPHLAPAIGILNCKWIATKMYIWVKNQGVSPTIKLQFLPSNLSVMQSNLRTFVSLIYLQPIAPVTRSRKFVMQRRYHISYHPCLTDMALWE